MANPVSVPNTFTAATDAVAAEVNANFDSLVDYINDNMVTDDGTVSINGTQTVNNLIVSGTLTAQGNLNVDGTFKGDVVASNGTSVVLSNGTNGSNATFKGDILDASGTVIVDVSAASFAGDITGNANTANTLANGRLIDITGLTATAASFNGSTNIEIDVTDVPASLLSGTVAESLIDSDIARKSEVYGYEDNSTGFKISADNGTGAPSNSVGGNGDIYIRY